MSLRFFFDNCANGEFLAALRSTFGPTIASAAWELGRADLPDEPQLAYAAAHGLVLYTHDYDFITLYDRWFFAERSHAGIIICHDRRKTDIAYQLSRFRTLLHSQTEASMRDALVLLEAVDPTPDSDQRR